jgi:hypothetical protein
MEFGALGAEGVIEVRYVSQPAIKSHIEKLGRTICQTSGGLPFLGLLIFSPHQRK